MTIETMQKLLTQQRHMDVIEDQLLQILDQLKNMRLEHEEIMTNIVKEHREPVGEERE